MQRKVNDGMRLGVAYNVFNGDELLFDSLKRMRQVSDYIVITYQEVSNTGNVSESSVLDRIKSLPNYLYDDLELFTPSAGRNAQKNEVSKRNLGLKLARKKGCTHFMSIDCDEFYDLGEFIRAKKIIWDNNYDSSACELVNYFHSSMYRMKENRQYVPFIFKISWWDKHRYSAKFPVPVDPTRRLKSKNFYLFQSDILLMHHMSYVRKDYKSIASKLMNGPNRTMYEEVLDEYLKYYNEWDQSQPAMNPHQYISSLGTNVEIISNPIELSIRYKRLSDFA